jgi:C1A family cysteine protease
LRASLAAGLPFTFGFTVYESFESEQVAETGVVPMPKSNEQIVGGHCVVAVGYDTPSRRFIVRNSWGDGWGDKGYCYLPWAFFTMSQNSLASDIWNIELVS